MFGKYRRIRWSWIYHYHHYYFDYRARWLRTWFPDWRNSGRDRGAAETLAIAAKAAGGRDTRTKRTARARSLLATATAADRKC